MHGDLSGIGLLLHLVWVIPLVVLAAFVGLVCWLRWRP